MRIYADVSKALNHALDRASLIRKKEQREEAFDKIRSFMLDLYHSLGHQYGMECHDYEPPNLWYKAKLDKDTERILNKLEQWTEKELR